MPKPTDGTPFSRKRPVWLLLGLIVLALGAFVFKPIQNHFRIRNAVEEWNAHLPDWSTNLPDDGSGPPLIDPAKASQVPRIIDSDLTLTAAKSPWFLPADVTVERGRTLTVEAGADLVMDDLATLFVFGDLQAEGTAEKPIRIRAMSRSQFWRGILIGNWSVPSVVRHAEISNAQQAFRPVSSELVVEHCVMHNIRQAVSAKRSHTEVRGCRFLFDDFALEGNVNVLKFLKGSMVVEDCEIYCPETDLKIDAIDGDFLDGAIIRGNRIHGSTCEGADAIDIGEGGRNILIEGNLITDLIDKGISLGEGSEARIVNNTIVRCGMGVGVKDEARALITGNTFYKTTVGVHCYEKISGEGGGHAEIKQSIFAACGEVPIKVDGLSSIIVSHSLCDTAPIPGVGNIHAVPVFENPDLDLFGLVLNPPPKVVGDAPPLPADFPDLKDLGSRLKNPGVKP